MTKYYWSTNSTYDASDTYLGERSIPSLTAGAISGPVSVTVTVPASATSGTYYILAVADANGEIVETSETNNTKYISVKIGADLIVSTLTGPPYPYTVTPGQAVTLTEATKNQGTVATAVNTVTKYYWSTNTTYDASDTYLGERSIPALAAGEISDPVGVAVTVPAAATTGTYYIFAVADAGGAVAETSETNNTKYVTVKVP